MDKFGDSVIGIVILFIVAFGMFKGVKVFDCFVKGGSDGLTAVMKLAPTLVGLIVAVNMVNAAGGFELLSNLFAPICRILGFPEEVVPLAIIRPFSGSGALAVFEDIIQRCGADSFQGRVASVIMGSTETVFYAAAVYFSAVGVVKTRYTVPCALLADMASYILAVAAVNLFIA